jgi:hypothetical protein
MEKERYNIIQGTLLFNSTKILDSPITHVSKTKDPKEFFTYPMGRQIYEKDALRERNPS